MNVITSQDVAMIACCPCLPDACEEPRKECQSISVSACGYSLPLLSTVPAEDRCKMFRKKESKLVFSDSYSTPFDGGNNSGGNSGTRIVNHQSDYVTIGEGDEAVRTCITRWFSDSLSEFDFSSTTYDDPEEDDLSDTSTINTSSGIDSPCSGTITVTASGAPDYTDPFNICGLLTEQTPTEDWTYATLGIFSLSEPYTVGESSGTDNYSVTYSEQVTVASLDAEIEVRKTMLDGDDWPGTACTSSVEYIYGYEDPPEIPDPAPDPPEPVPELAVVCEQVGSVTKARYRMGIPAGERWEATTSEWLAWEAGGSVGDEPPKTTFDAAHAAWVIAKAEWDAADPDERGDEPLEPTTRSTYELQWDEVFFSEIWTIWRGEKDAFDAATAAHEIWTECEEDCGDEPVIPEDPGVEPTAPSLVASRSWVYAADEWSEWFEIDVPEEPGETRVVNMLVICYRSASLGQKPTAHGEVYEF